MPLLHWGPVATEYPGKYKYAEVTVGKNHGTKLNLFFGGGRGGLYNYDKVLVWGVHTPTWKGLSFLLLWVALVFRWWFTFLDRKVLQKINANQFSGFWRMPSSQKIYAEEEIRWWNGYGCWRAKWRVKEILYGFLFLVVLLLKHITDVFDTIKFTLLILYSRFILM